MMLFILFLFTCGIQAQYQYHSSEFRVGDEKSRYFGVEVSMNVINPKLHDNNQMTAAFVTVQDFNGTNYISVGWEVDPLVNSNDNMTHFVIYNSGGTRFVPVSSDYYDRMVLNTSTFGDEIQQEMTIRIVLAESTKYWWISYESKYVGYLTGKQIPALVEGAQRVVFSGRTRFFSGDVSPPMGHGTFPKDPVDGRIADYARSGYFAEIQVVNSKHEWVRLSGDIRTWDSCPALYGSVGLDEEKVNGYVVMYGGPGGKDC